LRRNGASSEPVGTSAAPSLLGGLTQGCRCKKQRAESITSATSSASCPSSTYWALWPDPGRPANFFGRAQRTCTVFSALIGSLNAAEISLTPIPRRASRPWLSHAARAPSGDRPAVPTSRFGVNRLVGSAAGRGTVSPGDVALAHGPARPDPSPPSAQTPRTAPCDAFPRRYVDPRVHGHPPPFLARRLESRWASDPGADGQREVSRGRGTKIPSSIKLCPGSDHHFYLFDPSCPTPPPACKLSCLA
jgi:hypothetical protein